MLQGIAYAKGTVAVVYLGPVPDNEMIAFVLVLETQVHLPKIYEAQKVNDLFGEKVPCEITLRKEKRKELTSHQPPSR